MKFTILGADGWIGAACVRHLSALGHEVVAFTRTTNIAADTPLGHVIYAIGLTGDFREKPFETVDAHVSTLARWLQHGSFASFLYLSSTRVFGSTPTPHPVNEKTSITLSPSADSLYDLSKLMGEALCLSQALPTIRVVRLSNVYGLQQSSHNFLGSVLDSLRTHGEVVIRESAESSKDYVALVDVVSLLEKIAISGKERLYHVASGGPTTHAALAKQLKKMGRYAVTFYEGAPHRAFPVIDISRIRAEFGFEPRSLLDDLPQLLHIETA